MSHIFVDGQPVGDDSPTYFIAEIGGNYATFDNAKALIDAAQAIGVNAVKFQTFEADTITTKDIYFDMENTGRIRQYDLFKQLEPDKDLQREITKYSREKGLTIFSAPSHLSDIELMEELDLPVYKIGSDLAVHLPLLEAVGKLKKPVILSTGMCTLEEVQEAVDVLRASGNDQIALMHCISDYPTKPDEVNLRSIQTLKSAFGLPVGFSDHTVGIDLAYAAIAVGADLIEKHFTMDKSAQGPDHMLSLLPQEFQILIGKARILESAMGDGIKAPSVSEVQNMQTNRVSIVALETIAKGERIFEHKIDVRRPGSGLAPKYWQDIIGKRASRDIQAEEPIRWELIEK